MLTGFKSRLLAEIKDLQQHPKYSSRIALKVLKVHRPPAKSNYVSWLGGILFVFVCFLVEEKERWLEKKKASI